MSTNKKITLKDIAKILDITPSAVSKALSNHPRISEDTKSAVKKIAGELNYQPNQLASALRKGKSHKVGVVIPRNHSSFFSSVVENIENVLNTHGYQVIITQSYESYEKECKNIETLLHSQVDGIIASIANETVNLDFYDKIIEKGVPLILFDRGQDNLPVDFIGINDFRGSEIVVNHLIEQGCKRIAHLAGNSHSRIYKDRINGYIEALKQHGLEPIDELIIESELRIEDGRSITKELLNLKAPPDAIYAAGDFAALGALQVLQETGIKVPEEMALVGFSNEPFTSYMTPSISTVNQYSKRIGQLAAEAFLKRMKTSEKVLATGKIILEPELVVRTSSDRKKDFPS